MTDRALSLHDRVLDVLGPELIDGVIAAGDRLTLEELQARFGVSRTVARDAIRTLDSLGFVTARRRVGITVLDAASWRTLTPRVMQWRLRSGERDAQFRDIVQLRHAIEPVAAAHAARHASDGDREHLVTLARALRERGQAGDLEAFLHVDTEFHGLVLSAGGNRQFAAMRDAVELVLTERTRQGLMPFNPRPEALRQHEALARAIASGNPDDAAAAALAIITEADNAVGDAVFGDEAESVRRVS